MKKCNVTIATTVDGRESKVSRQGECVLDRSKTEIRYREENAEVCVVFENGTAFITRAGDYSLKLQLRKGETLAGAIGIEGAEGEVYTRTTRLQYAYQEESFSLEARYELLTGGEPQKMRIRIVAKES